MAFVHLHNHTVFSMLDGATRIQDMVNRAVELGMPAVAITDHGYMYGVPDLALACDAVNHNTPEYKTWSHDKAFLEKDRRDELVEPDPEENPREHAQYVKDMAMWDEKGNIDELKPPLVIKPIFGCEVYFTPDETLARDHKPELYHMILLAKDQEGYVNLMQTVSEAAVQGFYYKPRVTLDNLRRHAKGMICTSACIAGIIPKYIDRGDMEGAIKWAETFRDTFDPGDFYIEIQEHGITTDNGLPDEQLDRTRYDIAKQLGVKVTLDGYIPPDTTAEQLITAAVLECVTNCIRHAKGDRVNVKITEKVGLLRVQITNNGEVPKDKITEGSGLSSRRRSVEASGADMKNSHLPAFALTLYLPRKEDDNL